MRVIEQSIEFETPVDGEKMLDLIESACRNCYKSEGFNANHNRAKRDSLIRNAVRLGHHSVLEHGSITFRVITNRAITHQWVRHRIGVAYSQESTRYCNYGKGDGVTYIRPHWMSRTDLALLEDPLVLTWYEQMTRAEQAYLGLLAGGLKPDDARGVLPHDTKTELVTTMNLRAIRHFISERCRGAAHPQIRELAHEMLDMVNSAVPVVLDDMMEEFADGGV